MATDPKYPRRWEDGTPHHPRSHQLMHHMKAVDNENGGNHMDLLETGGDGDTGEDIMFLMDGFFEQSRFTELDRLEKENTTLRAMVVQAGVCPYGGKEPGAPMNTCRSGFPGCACMDDLIAAGE